MDRKRILVCLALLATFALAADRVTGQQVAAGEFHSCYIDAGSVVCFGDTNQSQGASTVPSWVSSSGFIFVQICASVSHSCGLTDQGGLFCW